MCTNSSRSFLVSMVGRSIFIFTVPIVRVGFIVVENASAVSLNGVTFGVQPDLPGEVMKRIFHVLGRTKGGGFDVGEEKMADGRLVVEKLIDERDGFS